MGVATKDGLRCVRRILPMLAVLSVGLSVIALPYTSAGASSRQTLTATTTPGNAGPLLALGATVLVLGCIGIVGFFWMRRKRRPNECAEEREALELAERAVRYWEGARAHLEAAEKERMGTDAVANEDPAHASSEAKAIDGLNNAMQLRDQRQMDLIRCVTANSGAALPTSTPPESQPFFIPRDDGSAPPVSSTLDEA